MHDWRMFEWPLETSTQQVAAGWLQWDVVGAPGHDLPTLIVAWLAQNLDLPPIYSRPEIFVSVPIRLTALGYGHLGEATKGAGGISAIGSYDDATRRVYVRDGCIPE